MRIAVFGALGASLFSGAILSAVAAIAQINQFEIKEPKVEAGEIELEYLGDYHFGQPRRRLFEESPGSFVFDANEFNRQRHTIGIGYGVSKWLGLQVEIEAEEPRFEDATTIAGARAFDDLKLTEVEVEATVVLARTDGVGVAALIEHDIAIDRRESDQLFLGTALQYTRGPWSATANLYAVKNFGGREELDGAPISDERWDFQYAAQLKYQATPSLALALEGYGVVERLGNSGTRSEARERFGDVHRHLLGPVLYYSWGGDGEQAGRKAGKGLHVRGANADGKQGGDSDKDEGGEGPRYTLGAGVLLGLNENTADIALKWSLGVEF